MNENRNDTTKWLQYLLYVGIASLVNSLLGIFGLGGLSRWIGLVVNGATIYLLFMLAGSNPRYKTAAIFFAVALVSGLISNVILGLVGSICGIVGQYQEYHAHGELIEARDPKLADKWHSLFWLKFGLTVITVLLTSVVVASLVMAADMDEAVVTVMTTVIVAALGIGLIALYLSYLSRTIKLLENEIVVE